MSQTLTMIERICLQCNKRIKPGSKLKIYCQGHEFSVLSVADKPLEEFYMAYASNREI